MGLGRQAGVGQLKAVDVVAHRVKVAVVWEALGKVAVEEGAAWPADPEEEQDGPEPESVRR